MEEEVQSTVDVQKGDVLEGLAKQYGWDPTKGDKSPKEFIEYAMQNLEPRGKELKEVKQTLAKVESHIESLAQERYERKLQELNQRKVHAIESQDFEAVDKIYAETQQLKQDHVKQPTSPVEVFTTKYASLINDASLEAFEIRQFVASRDEDLGKRSLSPEDHLAIIEKDMLKKFPDYFNISQAKPNLAKDAESSTNMSGKKSFGINDLNPEQREIALAGQRMGRPIEKYIETLAKLGELK